MNCKMLQRIISRCSSRTSCEGQREFVHNRWKLFFSDPSQWWDNRTEKVNARYPDFRHKKTQESLWLDSKLTPPWVVQKLSAIAPATVQLDIFTWNKRISRCAKTGQYERIFKLLQEMEQDGITPDKFTFVPALNACSKLKALEDGKCIHQQIIKFGYGSDIYVCNSLVDMYAKCGSIENAWRVFNKMPAHDVVTWNALILGSVKCGLGLKALELSQLMQQEGVEPDAVTFVGLLCACASVSSLEQGRLIHNQIIASGCESDAYVGGSLVDMYGKCGSIQEALRVFSKMPVRNAAAWNAMILGFVKCGQPRTALKVYQQMYQDGVKADSVTFVGLLNACASVGALDQGRRVHEQIIQSGWETDIFVGSSLVDMYAKCGSVEDALRTFKKMPVRNWVSWTGMLGGFAMHGHAKEALEHFEQMSQGDVHMDGVTFVSLLSVCSHGGFVDECLHYFSSMSSVYNISPSVEHYACIIDSLGRAGCLHEAFDLIKGMYFKPNASVWRSLLSGCRIHGNFAMGEFAAKQVLELEPGNSSGYVLLSNIYAGTGKFDESDAVHRQRIERGIQKQPGCTWIEVNNDVHLFKVGDSKHPQILEVHKELERLSKIMKEAGHVPDANFLFHDVDEERKEVYHHSEMLAIAFGLISTPPHTPLRILKNLRVCGDCHTATKFIAKLLDRVIVVRDIVRFHHFKDGFCSCRDYW